MPFLTNSSRCLASRRISDHVRTQTRTLACSYWVGSLYRPSGRERGGVRRAGPAGHPRLLFAFFAAMAATEQESIRDSTLEGLDTAACKGKHGGRPPVITEDMLHTVLRCRAAGESVEQTQPGLIIPRQTQRAQPLRREHLPGTRRTREGPGATRGDRGGSGRLHDPCIRASSWLCRTGGLERSGGDMGSGFRPIAAGPATRVAHGP